jgi:hypothetical protein
MTTEIDKINKRINNEFCNETINKLKDNNLLEEYKDCKSVQNSVDKLINVLCVIQKGKVPFWIIANIFECVVKKVPFLTAPYSNVLEKHKISDNIKKLIINDYLIELIPPGTKGVIRGNKFNSIVKNTIENMCYVLFKKKYFFLNNR